MSTLVYFNDCPEKMASKILDVLIGFMTIMIISFVFEIHEIGFWLQKYATLTS